MLSCLTSFTHAHIIAVSGCFPYQPELAGCTFIAFLLFFSLLHTWHIVSRARCSSCHPATSIKALKETESIEAIHRGHWRASSLLGWQLTDEGSDFELVYVSSLMPVPKLNMILSFFISVSINIGCHHGDGRSWLGVNIAMLCLCSLTSTSWRRSHLVLRHQTF